MSKCKSCGKELVWVISAATGNVMPVDAFPSPDGNIVIQDGMAHVLGGHAHEGMLDGPRHKSHFATCENAAKHQKEKP